MGRSDQRSPLSGRFDKRPFRSGPQPGLQCKNHIILIISTQLIAVLRMYSAHMRYDQESERAQKSETSSNFVV